MSRSLPSTPSEDGFRMPGEWERHDGCWMIWPERTINWRSGCKPAQAAFAQVAAAVADAGERVTMGVSPAQFHHARTVLPEAVRVVEMSSEDSWARDQGPTFVIDDGGKRRAIDWRFNAWGGLYTPHFDADLAQKIIEAEDCDRYAAPLVLEGGSIHVDGEGTCLTTEECLLSPNRNPDKSKAEIEDVLRRYLNVDRVIWLGRGVLGDITNGHVDNLACFVEPGVVCLTWPDDEDDPQREISADALRRLKDATDAQGRRLDVHLLPMPGPLVYTAEEVETMEPVGRTDAAKVGARMAASYVNYYVANDAVMVPLLDESTDERALEAIATLYPGRSVVGIPGREILLGGGNIHCITQQVPATTA